MRKNPFQQMAIDPDKLYQLTDNTLYFHKILTLAETQVIVPRILKEIKSYPHNFLYINLDNLSDIDSSGVMALFYLQKNLRKAHVEVHMSGGNESISRKVNLFMPDDAQRIRKPVKTNFFEQLGSQVNYFFTEYLFGYLILAANISYWAVVDLFRPKARREGEFVNQSVLIGVNAAFIVMFMSFIIGLVMALHSSQQLRTFGANIYIVDLVVIAMMSQMGPLITAILVAGRSGSSIAAEIATMKVTSELDALKTMGLNPIRFVVVPKLYASLLTLPFLIILANVSGILGGAVAANIYLDITPEIFINRMGNVMQNKDLFTGFVKSQVYAGLIVLTGSFYGFRVIRGAEGVGKATTTAVVVAISLVIIGDSILGLLFY